MSIEFWVDGRLNWAIFGIVVYSLAGALVLDYVWRVVTVRAVVLVPSAAVLWLLGVAVGLWAAGGGW